jgi:galactokinase
LVLAKLHQLVLAKDNSPLHYSLRGFHEAFARQKGYDKQSLDQQLHRCIETTKNTLSKNQCYTRQEIATVLNISLSSLEEQYFQPLGLQAEILYLRQRSLHCFEEARRVYEYVDCLAHTSKLDETKARYLGQLMNDSHESCRMQYECSIPELDEICATAREAGALGSRLTGAGWGGCTVHLVPADKVEAVKQALKEKYYLKRFTAISDAELKEAFVVSKPSSGSFVSVSTLRISSS